MVFSEPIAKDVKHSSFKTEDPLLLEDGVLPDGPVDSSCIYKTKYDMMLLHMGKSYGEKVDLIKNVFVAKKNFRFPETTTSLKYDWLLLFP